MFHKQNARQPVAAALLSLLLALDTAFSCIGLSGWASFRRQLDELDAQYTTVAYSTNTDKIKYAAGLFLEDGSIQLEDGTIEPSKERINRLTEDAPGLLRRDSNVLAAAHTPNQMGFSSGAADPLNYVGVYDAGRYAQSVMAVRCISAEKEIAQFRGEEEIKYRYTLEWVEPVCRMAVYDLPEPGKVFQMTAYDRPGQHDWERLIDFSQGMEDAVPFPHFEEGKTYLVRGDFIDFHIMNFGGTYRETADYRAEHGLETPMSNMQHIEFLYRGLPVKLNYFSPFNLDSVGHPYPFVPNFYRESSFYNIGDNPFSYSYLLEDSWPFYAEYEGDWRDFLNTEEGKVWRDEIIPCCETSHDSVPVLFTDNIQALFQFCKQESALLEGRFITQEEYDTGAAVCMVGADYALYNGLQVGDTLSLDLYRPAYITREGVLKGPFPVIFNYTFCMPLVEENRLDVTRDYTIVGLYSAPARPSDPDGHGFRGDTVLAPKASAPEVVNGAEEDKVTPLLNTLVLKNGSIEEFEAYMAENGAADRFRYYDYGYSEMKESIEAMEDNALRLAALGGAAFLIGTAVFLLASFARMSAPARSLRLLGANPNKVTGEMLSALLPLTAAGVAFGGVLGGLLYGTVCEAVLSQTLAPDWPGLAVCAALELLVLGAAAAVWAALMARRGLMKRKQE